jgi:hypothetical protein
MKKLKQTSLFDRLKKDGIPISAYVLIHKIYNQEAIDSKHLEKLNPDLYVDTEIGIVLTEKAMKVLTRIDDLFATKKNIKLDELLGNDYPEMVVKYNEIFPKEKLPSNAYGRTNVKNLETNFKWFFQEYEYSWDIILGATQMYVTKYRIDSYKFMKTSMYFIRKENAQKMVVSELANWCEMYLKKDDYQEPKSHTIKVMSRR